MITCKKCGVIFDEEIAQEQLYKEYKDMGCYLKKSVCPVCHNQKRLESDTDFAFSNEETKAFFNNSDNQ